MPTYTVRTSTTPSWAIYDGETEVIGRIPTQYQADTTLAELNKALAAGQPPPPPTPTVPDGQWRGRMFASTSLWNRKLSATETLATNSASIVAALKTLPLNRNTRAWTANVSIPKAGTARHTITWDHPDGPARISDVPLSQDAVGSPDTDNGVVVIDYERGKAYDFFRASMLWNTHKSAQMSVYNLDGPGWWDQRPKRPENPNGDPWISTMSSSQALVLGGLVFPEELNGGLIAHALMCGVPYNLLGPPVNPARYSDGTGTAIPNGTRWRIKANVDLNQFNFGTHAKVVAKALQDYGCFVVDQAGGCPLYFRSSANLPSDPYASMNFTNLDNRIFNYIEVVAPQDTPRESILTQPQYTHPKWPK